MKITLTKKESIEYFYNALCNGLSQMNEYGLELQYNSAEYKISRAKITTPCYEDVLMQMLKDGYSLTMLDVENNGDETKTITINDVYSNVSKTPANYLLDMANKNDDANTADAILQTVFFGSLVFA